MDKRFLAVFGYSDKKGRRTDLLHGIPLSCVSLQYFPVGLDDFPIPVERFLPRPVQRPASVLLLIHIDEPVPFFHLSGARADQSMGAQEV